MTDKPDGRRLPPSLLQQVEGTEKLFLSGRRNREADLEKWVQRYAERLEHYCRLAPYNWFNFYDFWGAPPLLESEAMTSRPV